MRRPAVLLFLLLPCASYGAEEVALDALVAAAKKATISEIDYSRHDCHDMRTVEAWLQSVVGKSAKSIVWAGGACQLVIKENPRDAGSKWCARAEITPKQGGDKATVEVFFDAPRRGRPGAAFSFRGIVNTKDGWDYVRETGAFEGNWRKTYTPGEPAPASDDCP